MPSEGVKAWIGKMTPECPADGIVCYPREASIGSIAAPEMMSIPIVFYYPSSNATAAGMSVSFDCN
jgi:hypothetical protein